MDGGDSALDSEIWGDLNEIAPDYNRQESANFVLLRVADEPTGNLDASSANDVLSLLSVLSTEDGKTIVLVTHDPHAAHYAKTIRYLDKGVLLPEGNVPQDWIAAPISRSFQPMTDVRSEAQS